MLPDEMRTFVRAQTLPCPVPLAPEISLHTATEVTPLWQVTERWLHERQIEPPFWAFPWAGGQALARHVLDHPSAVRGLRVFDFASGSGLVAIAAAISGARSVLASDIDPLAGAACAENAARNGVSLRIEIGDRVGQPLPDIDVLLAGDIFYGSADSLRFLPWLRSLVAAGTRVLVGDPGRAYGPREGCRELAVFDVPTSLDLEGCLAKRTAVYELLP